MAEPHYGQPRSTSIEANVPLDRRRGGAMATVLLVRQCADDSDPYSTGFTREVSQG